MAVSEAAVRPKSASIRVLLVDDHPVLRSGLKALLDGQDDIEVVAEAVDGKDALQLAPKLQLDVVIMDVAMPRLGGAEATQQLLLGGAELRVLALSAYEDASSARSLLDAGASGYALKRSAGDELVHAVRIVASGGTYVDPAIAGPLMATQARAAASPPAGISLSEREIEVIRLVAQGHTSKEMASNLGLSPRTLETYKARAMSKLGLRTRADLIRYAVRCGWLQDS
jgi:DNA-binding NarL/FixJ family response regulator